ncbi:MAG: hypothetical protein GXP25_17300 [Planctomycetes bacterium]|nr:hypothetical protein [Planctomycetota bacterium]
MSELKDHFTLNSITHHLMGFEPPAGAFEPTSDWEMAYGVYTLGSVRRGPGHRTGTVRLRRQAAGDGATLTVNYEKPQAGKTTYRLTAELHCRTDALSTPTRWTCQSVAVDADGKPVPNTSLKKSAEATEGVIVITDGKRERRIPVGSAYTTNWSLFDAVQRLPRRAFDPIRFTLIDNLDQVKPDHTLSFRTSDEVVLGEKRVRQKKVVELEKGRIRKTRWAKTGGRPVRLHAYDHLGEGVVPEVYWVDDPGRLLFMVAGLEAYILDTKSRA